MWRLSYGDVIAPGGWAKIHPDFNGRAREHFVRFFAVGHFHPGGVVCKLAAQMLSNLARMIPGMTTGALRGNSPSS